MGIYAETQRVRIVFFPTTFSIIQRIGARAEQPITGRETGEQVAILSDLIRYQKSQ